MHEVHTPGLPPPDDKEETKMSPIATFAMIGGLCFAALSFLVFGIGYALGEWGGSDEAEDEVAVQTEEPNDKAEAGAETGEAKPLLLGAEATPVLEANAAPKPVDTVDGPLPGAEPVPEYIPPGFRGASGSGASGGGDSAGSAGAGAGGDGQARAAARVSVTLVLKHYQRVDVKLGGKVFHLEGDKTIKIRPGGYRLELRKSPDDPWKSAGLIEVDLGHAYSATLLDPPLVKLETL